MLKCPPFEATQASAASLQAEDADCGGVATAHYGGVETPRPACHFETRSRASGAKLKLNFALFTLSTSKGGNCDALMTYKPTWDTY